MFRIFAFLSKQALGDFMMEALAASAVRDLFDEGELFIYYRDDRPYKKMIVSCIPNVTGVLASPNGSDPFPVDYFGGGVKMGDADLNANEMRKADLILTRSMFSDAALNCIPLPTLRPPLETFDSSDENLLALGLDPSKWIATVYWKELGYQYRGHNRARMIYDPGPYIAAIRHIVEDLGGQVVRLGHTSPEGMPKIKGLVDLATVAESEWMQLYAVSVSRFMLASASGPSIYGASFGVPTVLTDHIEVTGVWRDHDYIVTQGFVEGGREYRQMEAFDAGYLNGYPGWKDDIDFTLRRNTAAELIAATDEMFHATKACIGWRSLGEGDVARSRPNKITLPLPGRLRPDLLIPPSQRRS
jgi:putative glycosyltransferase (TIGR04372 family)